MPGEATSKYHRPWPPAEEAAAGTVAPGGDPAGAGPPAFSAAPYNAALRAALRSRGMRVTPQRLAVHSALHDIGRHSTAEEVLDRVHGTVPGVSLPTVYAALELLTDLGLALMITDYNMPDIDGFELTRRIRGTIGSHQLRIIGVSSSTDRLLSARFLKAGGNDFIMRPFIDEEFYCRVNQNLDTLSQMKLLLSKQKA